MSGFFSSFKKRTRDGDIRKIERICKETGKAEKLRKILSNCNDIDINSVRYDGFTVLHLCALNNFIDCIRYLLSIGADTLLDSDNDGSTAFHLACWGASLEAVKLLLPNKDTLLETNQKGYTGLHFACASGKEDIYRCLLELGANPYVKNREGYTPMLLAACNGQTDAVKFLIDNSYANVNDVNSIGASALHMACAGNYISLTNYLLTSGASVYMKDDKGRYPIDFCKKSKSDCRKLIDEFVRKKGPGLFNSIDVKSSISTSTSTNQPQTTNPVSLLSYIGSSFWSHEKEDVDYFEEPIMKHQIEEDNTSIGDPDRSDISSKIEGAWGEGDWMTEYSENPSDSKMNELDNLFLQYNDKQENRSAILERDRENKKKLGYGLTVPAYKPLSSSLLKEIPVKKINSLLTDDEAVPQKTSKTTNEDDSDNFIYKSDNANKIDSAQNNNLLTSTAAVASWITFGVTDGLLAVSNDDQPHSVAIAIASSGDTPRKEKNHHHHHHNLHRNESFDLESLEGSVSSAGNLSSAISENTGSLCSSTFSDIRAKKSPYSSVKNEAHLR